MSTAATPALDAPIAAPADVHDAFAALINIYDALFDSTPYRDIWREHLGSGPRVCIGRQVALTEAQFALAGILQSYDVEVLTDDLQFRPAVTLQPATTVEARVTARD